IVPTKSVPLSPSAIERAPATFPANTETSNPGGTLRRARSMRACAAQEAASMEASAAAASFMAFPSRGLRFGRGRGARRSSTDREFEDRGAGEREKGAGPERRRRSDEAPQRARERARDEHRDAAREIED